MKNNKLRAELIKSKLSKLIDTLNVIEENLPTSFSDFKNSRIIRDAIYKEIEFCIEIVLDICSIINSDLSLGMPEVEENILDNIEKKKILDKKTMNLIREMKKFRNVLVHKYGEIDDEQAFETIKENLNDFNYVSEEIEKLLKKIST